MLDIERNIRDYSVVVRHAILDGRMAGTRKAPWGGYLILIHRDLCRKSQMEALEHELLHIIFGHFDDRSELPEWQKEAEVESDWIWICDRKYKED